jgi:hypothetical protein
MISKRIEPTDSQTACREGGFFVPGIGIEKDRVEHPDC